MKRLCNLGPLNRLLQVLLSVLARRKLRRCNRLIWNICHGARRTGRSLSVRWLRRLGRLRRSMQRFAAVLG